MYTPNLTNMILKHVTVTSCKLYKFTIPQEQSVMLLSRYFLTWGILLLTHSVLGRISSHMIMHRASVCWRGKKKRSKYIRFRRGGKNIISLMSRETESWRHTNPQEQKLWFNEVQQKPSVWRFQPISNRPNGQNGDEKREC